jgi:DNA-binding transcriptional ArsR family regulator
MFQPQRIDAVFHALSDPTRRRILERLAVADRPVTDLVAQFDMSQPAVTKHLNVLEGAGLITRRRDGRLRYACARRDAIRPSLEWMRRYASLWNARLDALESLLADPAFRQELDK